MTFCMVFCKLYYVSAPSAALMLAVLCGTYFSLSKQHCRRLIPSGSFYRGVWSLGVQLLHVKICASTLTCVYPPLHTLNTLRKSLRCSVSWHRATLLSTLPEVELSNTKQPDHGRADGQRSFAFNRHLQDIFFFFLYQKGFFW